MKMFHIDINVKDSKEESDRSVFWKMNRGYHANLQQAKKRWLNPLWLKSLRRVHLVKVCHDFYAI